MASVSVFLVPSVAASLRELLSAGVLYDRWLRFFPPSFDFENSIVKTMINNRKMSCAKMKVSCMAVGQPVVLTLHSEIFPWYSS